MSVDAKTIERLRKLLALARRGSGGERQNAEAKLRAALDRHGLRVADLDRNEIVESWFRFKSVFERRLLGQISLKVTNDSTYWTSKAKPGQMMFRGTVDQIAEIELLFGLYRRQLRIEFERLFMAFVQRNEIFRESSEDDEKVNLDPEEVERIVAMMRGIERVNIRKAIEVGQ